MAVISKQPKLVVFNDDESTEKMEMSFSEQGTVNLDHTTR